MGNFESFISTSKRMHLLHCTSCVKQKWWYPKIKTQHCNYDYEYPFLLGSVQPTSSHINPQRLRSVQVSAPKKKTKKEKDEAAENVEPKKPSDLAEEFMPEMLRSAGVARSHAIKLCNVTYGKDLGENLLKFAVGMEELYKQMQSALNGGDASKLVSLYTKAKAKEDSDGASAKANLWLGPCSFFTLFWDNLKNSNCIFFKFCFLPLNIIIRYMYCISPCCPAGGSSGSFAKAFKEEGRWRKEGKEGQKDQMRAAVSSPDFIWSSTRGMDISLMGNRRQVRTSALLRYRPS